MHGETDKEFWLNKKRHTILQRVQTRSGKEERGLGGDAFNSLTNLTFGLQKKFSTEPRG